MTNPSLAALAEVSLKLAAIAPEQWREFVTIFSKMTDGQMLTMAKSPAADVFVAQGKAQALLSIQEVLVNAHEHVREQRQKQETLKANGHRPHSRGVFGLPPDAPR